MNEAILFTLSTVLGIAALLFTMRFYLQFIHVTTDNPITPLVYLSTNKVVDIGRSFVPGIFSYEIISLILAWMLEVLLIGSKRLLLGFDSPNLIALFSLGVLAVLKTIIYIVIFAVFIRAVLSWINPYSPIIGFLDSVTYRFLSPIQRRIRLIAGIDLSPLILLFFCQLLLIWPIGVIEFYILGRL